jgi:hypothetical protein
MKKIFLVAMMAMSLCSYSFAQDDDDEYEEDSPRAAAVETTTSSYSAPAKANAEKKSEDGEDAFMGISLELLGLFNGDLQRMGLVFRLAENMELTAHLGLAIFGDTDGETQDGHKIDGDDGYTQVSIGAGFDFFFNTGVLPISLGGDIIFTHFGEDNNQIDIAPMFGMRAEIIKNFTINGKVGFDIAYHWWSDGTNDYNKLNFGIASRVNFIWFFL